MALSPLKLTCDTNNHLKLLAIYKKYTTEKYQTKPSSKEKEISLYIYIYWLETEIFLFDRICKLIRYVRDRRRTFSNNNPPEHAISNMKVTDLEKVKVIH